MVGWSSGMVASGILDSMDSMLISLLKCFLLDKIISLFRIYLKCLRTYYLCLPHLVENPDSLIDLIEHERNGRPDYGLNCNPV